MRLPDRAIRSWHTRHIDSAWSDRDDGTTPPAGQDELPFDQPAHPSWFRRLDVALQDRLDAAVDVVRRRPRRAAAVVAAFLLRWALRIALPLSGAAAMLHLFPYHATAGGVHFRVQGTILTHSGLSADTTFGSWEFRRVDGLPIGAHISPENVDVVRLATEASRNGQFYVAGLRDDLERQVPAMVAWLAGEALIGLLLGLGVAAALNLAVRYLRRIPPRRRELHHRAMQLASVFGVIVLVGGFGALSYNSNWVRQSRVTGTLGALQLFPDQLSQYYAQQSKVFDVISAIAGIQAQLQHQIEQSDSQPPAYNVMFISDMHLASTYPLVAQYAKNFNVSLIVDTGDESEFGTRAEMTPTYLNQLRSLTRTVPMIWMAGNHDSPTTVDVMRSVPGVTVLGTKTGQPDGSYAVTAQKLTIFGLTIAAVPDPRVYGGPEPFGSNDDKVIHKLEQQTVDQALQGVAHDQRFDIFASHEPEAVQRIVSDLPGQVRQTNAGHQHAQNSQNDIQHKGDITLVEGSTGAGGLDNIKPGTPSPTIEFSIESVAGSCQFTKLVRFQLEPPPPGQGLEPATSQRVTAATLYLDQQKIESNRTCDVALGRTPVQNVASSP